MIGYHILCHGNFEQVRKLIDALYSKEDTFLIDIDDGNAPDTSAIDDLASLDNVHISTDAKIGWGGAGTLRKTLHGAFKLLALNDSWQYYIVLSGQDLPLRSNREIKNFLKKGCDQNTNYIRTNKAEVVDPESIAPNNQRSECVLWGDRGHTKVYACPGAIDPQTTLYARTLVNVLELSAKGEVYVDNADKLLIERRKAFFEKIPFYTGANWFNLHRSLIETMVDDPFTYELYDILRTTFIPDESFFQTYIMNTSFKETVDRNFGRLILRPGPVPRVKVFDTGDWDVLKDTRALFGRKFDTASDGEIVERVLAARAA